MQLGSAAVFCDTFDKKNSGIASRTGDLDPNVWGVSRATGNNNMGSQRWNDWASTLIQKCDGTISRVTPPNDVIICNGQLRQASNDNVDGGFEAGGVTVLAMYPKQPFDFAGRVGTVSFDVSNDSHGSHAAWPEFWLTDLPIPTPFNHHDSWLSLPQHGLGIKFHSAVGPNNPGSCQNGNNMDKPRWTVGAAVVIRNYVYEDSEGYGARTSMRVQQLDCVISSPGPDGPLNHVELKISQNQIDVWASDAGSTALRRIAVITNANLSLSRGLIWLQDAHYNADKGDPSLPSQREHTFTWDNVAFDGPFTYRDFSYDALDNNAPGINGSVNLGKASLPNQTSSWSVLNMPANPQAAAVRVLFNFTNESNPVPSTLNVIVNGHAHPTPWPYPDTLPTSWRTLAVTIPITDLVAGTNVVQIGSDQPQITANVNIVLVNVPGGVPVLPGSNDAYPAGGGSSFASMLSASNTPAPTVAFSASPTSITSGQISMVTWSSTNATSCTAAGSWAGTKATSGTLAVSPTSTANYKLTCTGTGGTSSVASTTVVVSAASTATPTPTPSPVVVTSPVTVTSPAGGAAPVGANCGMQLGSAAAFCDTFDNKNSGIPSRTGDLDPNVWGVSRATGNNNMGSQRWNNWASTLIQKCDGTSARVTPPNDVIICNGQLRQASNDNVDGGFEAGGVTVLAMYPKQPFDFAGRTGTVSFDVSNDSHGSHAAWPEFWLTDTPIPTPFNHHDSWMSFPQNGLGIKFHSAVGPGNPGSCPNGNNMDKPRWTVGSAVVIRNYVYEDTEGFGSRTNLTVTPLDCVIASPGPGGPLNHVELQISQNQIDVYASDAGSTQLRKIAVISNANLTLTRGLIWLEDAHYNADKGDPTLPSQREHTFTWDNVAFDGPFTYRDFSYDALDNTAAGVNGSVNLGKFSLANQTSSWSVANIPANPQASVVRVLFNFTNEGAVPTTLNVIVNGHAHPTPWPYPDTQLTSWRTFAVKIPITDLVAGTNTVQIGSDRAQITANVNVVLVDVPGAVPVLPGSNNAYPAGAASTGLSP